jgi:hypothetical protein
MAKKKRSAEWRGVEWKDIVVRSKEWVYQDCPEYMDEDFRRQEVARRATVVAPAKTGTPECYERDWRDQTPEGGNKPTPARCGPCPWEPPCSMAVISKLQMLEMIK